jgi:NADPH-dependent curcumin reductase CurA
MAASPMRSREIRFKSRPASIPTAENFEIVEVDVPAPGPGQIQVRNLWMSVDPYMRGRMTTRKSYLSPFELGAPLQGGAIGKVIASSAEGFEPGDMIQTMRGWRESFTTAADAQDLFKLPNLGLPQEAYLHVAGLTGLTAYIGIKNIANVRARDVVFVSAAAGAVGSIACQIAKIIGATVIGSAGGREKCAFLKEIGVDHVIDYKAESDLKAALARVAPDGIDVYFDNVGGGHLEAALDNSKTFARFALCGMISGYNSADASGPSNIALAVARSLRLEGYIVSNYFQLMPEFAKEMAAWIGAGKVKWRQTVEEGIERAPAAFIKLFTGENLGKMLVKLV